MTKVVFTHFDVSNWGKVTRAPLVSKTEVCFEKLKNQLRKVSTPLSVCVRAYRIGSFCVLW
jgi:hypothetical protein